MHQIAATRSRSSNLKMGVKFFSLLPLATMLSGCAPLVGFGYLVCGLTSVKPPAWMPEPIALKEPKVFKTKSGMKLQLDAIGIQHQVFSPETCDASAVVRMTNETAKKHSEPHFQARYMHYGQDFNDAIDFVIGTASPGCTVTRIEIATDFGSYPPTRELRKPRLLHRNPEGRWVGDPIPCPPL